MIALALLLDAIFGEPRWLWDRVAHPAVVLGRAIAWADRKFNVGTARRAKGFVLLAALVIGSIAVGHALSMLGWVVEAVLAAILLAQKSLTDHVLAVSRGLRMSVEEGRRQVAMIVGRDTNNMTATAVSRAAIESAAENVSDGVVAPLFWFALAGLPGILAYKAVNTADSMIGYLTPRHAEFGYASAKFDDLVNWIPARLTALGILVAHGHFGAWRAVVQDAKRHRSPNAGWPEAAVAQVHGIALSGPRSYEGEMRDFPYVNSTGRRDLGPEDIDQTVDTLWRLWALLFGAALLIAVVF